MSVNADEDERAGFQAAHTHLPNGFAADLTAELGEVRQRCPGPGGR